MAKIQRVASGLLSLIDNRATRETPNELLQTVQPSLDMRAFYEQNVGVEAAQVVQGTVAATGVAANLTIPDGELWSVYTINAYAFTPTAAADICVGIELTGLPGVPVTPGLFIAENNALNLNTWAAFPTYNAVYNNPQGLLLRAGTNIACNVLRYEAATWTTRITVMFAQLNV